MAATGLTCARKPPRVSQGHEASKMRGLTAASAGPAHQHLARFACAPPRPPRPAQPRATNAAPPGKNYKKSKADCTLRSSQAVPHPSTNRALRRLTSEVGRDLVYSARYGRQRPMYKKPWFPKPCLPALTYISCMYMYICMSLHIHMSARICAPTCISNVPCGICIHTYTCVYVCMHT